MKQSGMSGAPVRQYRQASRQHVTRPKYVRSRGTSPYYALILPRMNDGEFKRRVIQSLAIAAGSDNFENEHRRHLTALISWRHVW
eukprot:scaffold172412_cov42-Prasinocladus_malaysianus.AAC.1